MPLNFARFKQFPEVIKFFTLILTFFLMFLMETIQFQPPGTSMIWFTMTISIIFDIFTIALLLKEFDSSVMALRMLPYAALECTCSILIVVFYILSATLSISSEEVTDDFGFLIAAVVCLFIALSYLLNLVLNIRKWVYGAHLANPPNVYDYPSYGSD
ncbi:unnamed protein product [Caenorhabditis angaria]|uniref:MARVEL domain-containing protein n=1 Tax=Caenorhabditis angaria TaxID=860376 RepID=A0A9P1I8R1_9PELO|nr:unnamed protein product [Caenorhabditis angaria]